MLFKNERIKQEWESGKLSKVIKKIANEAANYASKQLGWELLLTCIHRTPEEDRKAGGSGNGVRIIRRVDEGR